MRFTVGVLAIIALASCKKTRDQESSRQADPVAKPGPPVTSVDEMIRSTFEKVHSTFFVAEIVVDYVRPNGTLDPTYGKVTVTAGKRRPPKPPKPVDDPNRPIGAPDPATPVENDYYEMVTAKCTEFHWTTEGSRFISEQSCSLFGKTEIPRPRCTVVGILAAAAAAGAPANALAKIELHATLGDGDQRWRLAIDDNPRDIHFRHEAKDDCDPIVEKP